ncbi:hypothetical protein [Dyadobacter sp. CY326]|uniref:hypothetical protein n=1 Tax=Dyadobacter sp. CY326 TaxID=2907300 RepID=UPI001F3E5A25|nr:hypothetical protein [Dyadobacter sp. CY326]MCE7066132.1 hypothetical protein [Dyadobacter sp. CY326]
MNILFLCSSLESGRDGVGDYTRRLAAALLRQGHQSCIVALHDRHLPTDRMHGTQFDEQQQVNVLRLSSRLSWKDRLEEVASFMLVVDPTWISLQYVAYGFQDKGLPWSLANQIKKITKERNLHIMFHELWLDKPDNFKQELTWRTQKQMIRYSIKKMNPKAVSATIPFNINRLAEIGVKASLIELFGNIPYKPVAKREGLPAAMPDGKLNLLYFGAAPKGEFLHTMVRDLITFCTVTGISIRFTIVCGETAEKQKFISALNSKLAQFGLSIVDVPFATTERLSELMQQCDVGVSRSAPYLFGKSGTAIAMLEHGMPIWVARWNGTDPLYYNFRTELIFDNLRHAANASVNRTFSPHPLLPKIASNFLNHLNATEMIETA